MTFIIDYITLKLTYRDIRDNYLVCIKAGKENL